MRGQSVEEPRGVSDATVAGVEGLAEAGVVPSDLSPFNILVHGGLPWFIDLAEDGRVDRLGSPPWVRLNEALRAVEKAGASLSKYFHRYGLAVDTSDLLSRVKRKIDLFRVV